MKHHLSFIATIAVAAAILPQIQTNSKSCIDNCRCKLNNLLSRLQIIHCDGPLVLNETTFRFINKPFINVLSVENLIINQIQEDVFKDFKNLEDVLILNSRIGSIDSKSFNSIKRVKFADCGFEDRPDLFSEKLEELHFGTCRLEEIPKLNGLLALTFLNLSGNYIKNVEMEAFAELMDLEILYLSDNEIFKLPPYIFINNQQLNSLYLDNNPLKYFYLNTSSSLEMLSIKNCELEEFDERSTQKLSSLNELNLSHNHIKNISRKALSHIKELSIINLAYNNLTNLDYSVFSGNQQLIKIYLDGNDLKNLPNFEIQSGESFSVYTFTCNYCGLRYLSSTVFRDMPGMLTLELSNNKFMNVEYVFKNIPSLKRLDISYNNITYFSPGTFVSNKNLETLNIAGNPLMMLNPEVFSKNLVLRQIDARNASIKKLWSNTNQFIRSVRRLYLSDNELTSLSEEDFKILPSLEVIDLNNNPLVIDDKLCNVINWLSINSVSPVEYTKNVYTDFDRMLVTDDDFTTMEWKDFHNENCPENIDSEYDYNYDDDLPEEGESITNPQVSYILSLTSAFILSALVVLTLAVTLTLSVLRRNANFNMHNANLPRFKIPLWSAAPTQKKHSGSVYRPLSEDLSGPKTPKLNRYDFSSTPTVHSS